MKQERRPCPICHGLNSRDCMACRGKGWFPYPWVQPEDESIPWLGWSPEEDAAISDAPTGAVAYERYCEQFGKYERTYSSVYSHWFYRQTHEPCWECWTEAELDIIDNALSVTEAKCEYTEAFGTKRTPEAVREKWRERNR